MEEQRIFRTAFDSCTISFVFVLLILHMPSYSRQYPRSENRVFFTLRVLGCCWSECLHNSMDDCGWLRGYLFSHRLSEAGKPPLTRSSASELPTRGEVLNRGRVLEHCGTGMASRRPAYMVARVGFDRCLEPECIFVWFGCFFP